ncbi:stage II sporulation protein P [Sporomusa termitida]|uniref:Stage II sporulation protein P n=1 Tax=Sporomusa termitida TaxID=2377 RepID=A0A517DUD7_9FIRM|nr:stage II sporulation protein P [Sporomusa termitida]QDR80957.1 stage II sporulation protein P [Sporomusa termitida]
MVTRKARKKSTLNRIWQQLLQVPGTSKLFHMVLIGFMLLLASGLSIATYLNLTTSAIPVSGSVYYDQYIPSLWPKGKDVLFSGIPGLSRAAQPQPAVKITPELNRETITRRLVLLFSGIDVQDLRSLFSQEIPFMLAFKNTGAPTVSAASLPNFPKFDTQTTISSDKPLVAIYHTHTAEAFLPNSGVTHRPGGQRGDIVDVGVALAKQLEKEGVTTIHNATIHDYPSFMKAYGPSEATAQKILAENPSIQMIFDIHRDADKRENVTAVFDGVPMAKITIVVATGQQDLPQPHWQQNHAFAKLIDARLNAKYPGICRGLQMVEWRYNQHLHPRALLIEVGSQESSKEEAVRSMEILGGVLAEILAENR